MTGSAAQSMLQAWLIAALIAAAAVTVFPSQPRPPTSIGNLDEKSFQQRIMQLLFSAFHCLSADPLIASHAAKLTRTPLYCKCSSAACHLCIKSNHHEDHAA
jgi:hypothetical protein